MAAAKFVQLLETKSLESFVGALSGEGCNTVEDLRLLETREEVLSIGATVGMQILQQRKLVQLWQDPPSAGVGGVGQVCLLPASLSLVVALLLTLLSSGTSNPAPSSPSAGQPAAFCSCHG